MTHKMADIQEEARPATRIGLGAGLAVLLALVLFMLGLDMVGAGFKRLGNDTIESILLVTSNPFVGLLIGLLLTALIQSSSSITSLLVVMVASGAMGLGEAVPMIMGANVGTTITSTLVSLGFITQKKEYKKAVAAAMLHDFFNVLTVLLLFPLEYYYGVLSLTAHELSGLFAPSAIGQPNALSLTLEGGSRFLPASFFTWQGSGPLFIVAGFFALISAIRLISRLLYKWIIGGSGRDGLQGYFFKTPWRSFGWGLGLTAAVQSSSVTTSLAVPFVATGRVSLAAAMPYIIGANVGTTLTAILAATFKSQEAVSLAMAHLLFNAVGAVLFVAIPPMRRLSVGLAYQFGLLTGRFRPASILYMLVIFFMVPFALIYFNKQNAEVHYYHYEQENLEAGQVSHLNHKTIISKRKREEKFHCWLVYNAHERLAKQPIASAAPDTVLNIYDLRKVLYADEAYDLKMKPGDCVARQDKKGRFEFCLSAYLPAYALNNTLAFDSVYVFTKRYENEGLLTRYVLAPAERLILEKSVRNANGDVLRRERLVAIKEE